MLDPKQKDDLISIMRLYPHLKSPLPEDCSNRKKRNIPKDIFKFILIIGISSFIIMLPFSIYYCLIYPSNALLSPLLSSFFPSNSMIIFKESTLLFEIISLTIIICSLFSTITPIFMDRLIIATRSFISTSLICLLESCSYLIFFINFSIGITIIWSFYHYITLKSIESNFGILRIMTLLDRILWMTMISSFLFLFEKKMILQLTRSFFRIIVYSRITPSHKDIYILSLLKECSNVFSNVSLKKYTPQNVKSLWKIRDPYPYKGRVESHFMISNYLHLASSFDSSNYGDVFQFISNDLTKKVDISILKTIFHPEDLKILPSTMLSEGEVEEYGCNEDEFIQLIKNTITERDALIKIMKTNLEIIDKIDKILSMILIFLIIFLIFPIADLRLVKKGSYKFSVGISFTPTIVGLTIIFGETVKSIFSSIIFLLSSHPYDVGDSIYMDKTILFVRKINLLYTVFERWDGFYCIYPNHSLSYKVVCNIRRSGYMSQYIEFQLPLNGSISIFDELESLLNARIKEKESSAFEGVKVSWVNIVNGGNSITIVLRLKHKFNFYFGGEKNLRNTRFYFILFTILKDRYGIVDNPPLRILQIDPFNVGGIVDDIFSI